MCHELNVWCDITRSVEISKNVETLYAKSHRLLSANRLEPCNNGERGCRMEYLFLKFLTCCTKENHLSLDILETMHGFCRRCILVHQISCLFWLLGLLQYSTLSWMMLAFQIWWIWRCSLNLVFTFHALSVLKSFRMLCPWWGSWYAFFSFGTSLK